MAELSPGSEFAGHRIEGVAGRGGFGVVYRATHLALDHVVALKLISSARAGEEAFRERFKSESRIAVSIRHPNVVAVHNAGEEDGLLFVTMDFIEGTDLRGLLNREGRLGPEETVDVVRQVASALDAAHAKGLVHRDIKPGNVLIGEREGTRHVYLTDFGLSKQMDATSGLTASGAFVGTLDYSAPEQIRGQRLDARTDVYALACVTYELLSGDSPFSVHEEQVAKLYAHLQDTPVPLADFTSEVPQELSDVIDRALSKDPDDRHPSAGDFARAAAAAVEGRKPSQEERSVGVGAAALTQTLETVTPEEPAATIEAEPPSTRESEVPDEPTLATGPPVEVLDEPTLETAPSAASAGRKRPWGRILGGALVVAALAAGAFVLMDGGSPDEPKDPARGGGGSGGLASGDQFSVPPEPVGIGIHGGVIWVSSASGQALTRLDAENGEPLDDEPIKLGGEGGQITFSADDGDAWVTVDEGGGAGSVLRFGPDGGEPVRIPVGSEPSGIAAGTSFVWTANSASDTTSKIGLDTNAAESRDASLNQPARVVSGRADKAGPQDAKGIWITNSGSDSVSRITDEGNIVSTVGVGANPTGIVIGSDERVWVAAQEADTLAIIQPEAEPFDGGAAGEPEGTVVLKPEDCDAPRSLAVGFGSVWATCADSGTVVRLDEANGEVQGSADVGEDPEGIATDGHGVWVTSGGKDGILTFLDPDKF
jgi:serine/threonine protein kinase/streptogramin lyase